MSPHGLGEKTSAEGSLPTVWGEKLQPKEVSPRSGEKNFSRRKSPHSLGRKTSAEGSLPTVWAKKLQQKEISPVIPNRLDFMHKIIISGVHEIAALVATFL